MQNTIFLSLFICFATTLEAQTLLPKRNTSLGIDLIFGIVSLSDNNNDAETSFELIYKEHLEKSALRFRGSITSSPNESQQIAGFKLDSTFLRTYYAPSKRYGLSIGGEFQIRESKNPMYAGLDVGFNYQKGFVEVRECLNEDCETVEDIATTNTALEFTPFLGWTLNLNERFFVNVELGPNFLVNFGDRPFADENGEIQSQSLSGTELNAGRILRDISINYRF